jgi:hypothetical protein
MCYATFSDEACMRRASRRDGGLWLAGSPMARHGLTDLRIETGQNALRRRPWSRLAG